MRTYVENSVGRVGLQGLYYCHELRISDDTDGLYTYVNPDRLWLAVGCELLIEFCPIHACRAYPFVDAPSTRPVGWIPKELFLGQVVISPYSVGGHRAPDVSY